MKFYTYTKITGALILIKTNIPTPPPCPVIAQSAKPAALCHGVLIRVVLWFVALFAPIVAHWPPVTLTLLRPRLTVLAIVAVAIVEVLAQGHIEKAIWVMT